MINSARPAILAGLASALLFGVSTPLAKLLLAQVPPCLAWAVDNNLTQRVSGNDPMQVAGGINLTIAISTGWTPPAVPVGLAALGVGLLGYG